MLYYREPLCLSLKDWFLGNDQGPRHPGAKII